MRAGHLAAAWGLVGFTALILMALYRLTPMATEALGMPLSPVQWTVLVINIAFMAYSEGYRGFQKAYSPRLVGRIEHLVHRGTAVERWLAPLYCMSFFNAERRQLLVTYTLTAMIIAFVVLFQLMPQPWRGVLDAGVVAGLVYGIVATWAIALRRWPRGDATLKGTPTP